MKIATIGHLSVGAIAAEARHEPPRVVIRAGRLRLSLTEPEAVRIAAQLIDAVSELRQTTSTSSQQERAGARL